MIKLIFILAFVGTAVHGQVVSGGKCPTDIPTKTPFDWNAYSGKWYTNSNTRSWMDLTGKCMTNTYRDLPLSSASLTLFQYLMDGPGNKTQNAKLTFPNITRGEYDASLPEIPFGIPLRVQIVDTDYGGCAVAYGCYQIPFVDQKMEFVWIKTRMRLPIWGIGYCDAAIAATKINRNNILIVDQLGCPWDL